MKLAKSGIPNFGHRFVFNAQRSEFELTFPDPMREFDAGDGDRAHRKRFNPNIGPKRSLINRWLHSVAHFAMYYDFVSIHTTLQTTPA